MKKSHGSLTDNPSMYVLAGKIFCGLMFTLVFVGIIVLIVLLSVDDTPEPLGTLPYPPANSQLSDGPKKDEMAEEDKKLLDKFKSKDADTYSFYNQYRSRYLSADSLGNLLTYAAFTPEVWEKFKLERSDSNWLIKTPVDKYISCEQNGQSSASLTESKPEAAFQFIKIDETLLVIYNPFHKKYLKISGDKTLCDAQNPEDATVWGSSPNNKKTRL